MRERAHLVSVSVSVRACMRASRACVRVGAWVGVCLCLRACKHVLFIHVCCRVCVQSAPKDWTSLGSAVTAVART